VNACDVNACEEAPMLVDFILGGIVTAVLLVYLTWALLRPERF
jgi:K+-transporting ATPase KdpF subunit